MTKCTEVVLWNLLPPWSPHAPRPVNAGGFVGVNSSLVTTSCWDTSTIGQTQGLGTSLGLLNAAGLTTAAGL